MTPDAPLKHLENNPKWNRSTVTKDGFMPGQDIYTSLDCFKLLHATAQATGAAYVNLADLEIETRNQPPPTVLETLQARLAGKQTAIIDGLFVSAWKPGSIIGLMREADRIGLLSKRFPDAMPTRLIFPTGFTTGQWSHFITCALEWDPKTKHMTVNLFEQHGRTDGSIRDFGEHLKNLGTFWQIALERTNPGITVSVNSSARPYCREEKVCSIVGIETAKKLILSKAPFSALAADPRPLEMDSDAVAVAHKANAQLMQREKSVAGDGAGYSRGGRREAPVRRIRPTPTETVTD